jgi:hypothetical protein
MKEIEEQEAKVSIEDFVSHHKVEAFCTSFVPSESESLATKVFNDAALRKYFQAFPRNIGDPLNVYLDMLEQRGFRMRTSIQGEPALFVQERQMIGTSLMLDAAFF